MCVCVCVCVSICLSVCAPTQAIPDVWQVLHIAPYSILRNTVFDIYV